MEKEEVKQIIAINENTPRGELTVAVAVDYGVRIEESSVSTAVYEVSGRQITNVEVVDGLNGEKEPYVLISLDPRDEKAMTRKMVGFGPNTSTKVTGPNVKIKQREAILTTDGKALPGWNFWKKHTKSVNRLTDQFAEHQYETKEGNVLTYHLYVPQDIRAGEKLPIVLFMHDSAVCSSDTEAPLVQGMGGVVWVRENEQKKRPCFVLVPQYRRKTAEDDFTVTWECEATVNLLKELTEQYPIDTGRIYGTGQSMGCMMLYEMNIMHPDLFASSFLVAGQWNPVDIAKLKDKNLWILVSEKDEKAYPINKEAMELLKEAGGKVATGSLDAKASEGEQQKFVENIIAQNANVQFTWYEGESVLPPGFQAFPGCFHLLTWSYAYEVEGIRKWMFSKHR